MKGTVTVNADGTTTTTSTSPTTSTTPTTPVQPAAGSPLAGKPSLRSSQHGGAVRARSTSPTPAPVGVSRSTSSHTLLPLARAKHSTRVRVGRFVRGSVSAGKLSFAVKLNARARNALKRHRRLALSVKIALTPFYGEPMTVTRSVIEHA